MTRTMKSDIAFQPSRLYKLPARKECLYHPMLPTFRRMDIDTAAHKLPDEHCRTTSSLLKDDFRNATVTLHTHAQRPLSCANVTETGRTLLANDERSSVNSPSNNISNETPTSPLPFSGYKMRYFSPAVTASWKYCLRQEPFIDRFGQRPVPSNIFSRHRNLHSASNVWSSPWRP